MRDKANANEGQENRNATNRASDPYFWVAHARQLDAAAMLIWKSVREDLLRLSKMPVGAVIEQVPHANLGGVFWLNAGLALENLFKGRIIKAHPELAPNGTIARPLKTHNLITLARRAEYELDAVTGYYMWVGTESVIWTGRYPCSTKPGEVMPPTAFGESDVTVYRQIFANLIRELDDPQKRCTVFERLA